MTMPTFEPKHFPKMPPCVAKSRNGFDLFDRIQMQQYAMQYLDLHVGLLTDAFEAGKQAAQVEQEPVAYLTYKGQLLHANDPKVAEHSNPEPLYAAPPEPAVPKWQPIETAPTDGTAILVTNGGGVWIAKHKTTYQSGFKPDSPWFCLMLNKDHVPERMRRGHPSHWMPLPASPEPTK